LALADGEIGRPEGEDPLCEKLEVGLELMAFPV
jgi:hypothetical protein